MPKANPNHRIEDVSFRQRMIRCVCGWVSRDVEIEGAWLLHRREHGLTSK